MYELVESEVKLFLCLIYSFYSNIFNKYHVFIKYFKQFPIYKDVKFSGFFQARTLFLFIFTKHLPTVGGMTKARKD